MTAIASAELIDVPSILRDLRDGLLAFDERRAEMLKSAGNVIIRGHYEAGAAADLIKLSGQIAEEIEHAEFTLASPLHQALAAVQAVTEGYWADVRDAIGGVREKLQRFRSEERARVAAQREEQEAEEQRLRAMVAGTVATDQHERLDEATMSQPQRQSLQNQGSQKPAPMSGAERLSAEDKLTRVLADLYDRSDEIASLLPADISFDAFHASVNQALRMNVAILKCHGPSIVNACIKAAYDGLKLDGREATIVSNNVKWATRPDQWREEARYMPMVFGLRKQILQSGLVQDVYTMLVWENEPFQVTGGLNRDILHEVLSDDKRGAKLKAVYSVAHFFNGPPTFEVMWRADIDQVRNAAQTDMVWNKWEGEMWRKTVLRRHRKSLPSTRDIIDMEAREMFPQFAQNANRSLPAPVTAPAQQPRAFIASAGQAMGYDLGFGAEPEREIVDHVADGGKKVEPKKMEATVDRATPSNRGAKDDLPHGPDEWLTWSKDLLVKICACLSVDQCNQLRANSANALEAAPASERDAVEAAFTDRIADLAVEGEGGAGPSSDETPQPAEKTS